MNSVCSDVWDLIDQYKTEFEMVEGSAQLNRVLGDLEELDEQLESYNVHLRELWDEQLISDNQYIIRLVAICMYETHNLLEDGQFSKEQVQAKVARVRSLSLMADQIAFEVGF